jgi:hypothetical protein
MLKLYCDKTGLDPREVRQREVDGQREDTLKS